MTGCYSIGTVGDERNTVKYHYRDSDNQRQVKLTRCRTMDDALQYIKHARLQESRLLELESEIAANRKGL